MEQGILKNPIKKIWEKGETGSNDAVVEKIFAFLQRNVKQELFLPFF